MEVVINSAYGETRVPIKMWLDDIEDGAFKQAVNIANLPFVFKHIAIMPDAHQGYGMPIGGVMATKGVVVPNAVGVDIGCGMRAERTNIKDITHKQLSDIRDLIIERVPTGFNHHKEPHTGTFMPTIDYIDKHVEKCIVEQEYDKALHQLGTLGGGNHFIEIQRGDDGYIWYMVHSGSRNLGKKVADHYNKLAVKENERWHSSIPSGNQLAFIPSAINLGKRYMDEMNYCIKFAQANRFLIGLQVVQSFFDVMGDVVFDKETDIAHNYARWENHFNQNVIVHRKGATSAREDEIGIIPGSQGSKSFMVKGLGNPMSFTSCSHGAGRVMGRKQATRELSLEKELSKMGNIIHGMETAEDLDESVGAYKNIDVVMNNQKDLVEIVTELTPLMVVKG